MLDVYQGTICNNQPGCQMSTALGHQQSRIWQLFTKANSTSDTKQNLNHGPKKVKFRMLKKSVKLVLMASLPPECQHKIVPPSPPTFPNPSTCEHIWRTMDQLYTQGHNHQIFFFFFLRKSNEQKIKLYEVTVGFSTWKINSGDWMANRRGWR